ncbi:hypothetical protein [Scopulibacillus cellulosilyticus]|uniref:Uncharacterized protein n=1 Tax=Scopulibacillus cellulosilyticus TaxID=2665665 RepID=A0ABW2PRE9_9BACL
MSAGIFFNGLPSTVLIGESQLFQVCHTATEPDLGTEVEVIITLSKPSQHNDLKVKVFNPLTQLFEPITFNQNGVAFFGPFPLENICNQVQAIFEKLGTYTVTLQMIRVSDGMELARTMGTVNAVPSPKEIKNLERRLRRCVKRRKKNQGN